MAVFKRNTAEPQIEEEAVVDVTRALECVERWRCGSWLKCGNADDRRPLL